MYRNVPELGTANDPGGRTTVAPADGAATPNAIISDAKAAVRAMTLAIAELRNPNLRIASSPF
jgi:hypothetical protein